MINYKTKELAMFYEKMAQLYRAGVPVTEGLQLAGLDVRDKNLRRGIERVGYHLNRGRTLTEGFSQSPDVFAELDLALINIGETQGRLDQSLTSLSQLYEREFKDIKSFLFAMIYPTFLLAAAIFLPPIIDGFNDGMLAYAKGVGSSLYTIGMPIAVAAGAYLAFKNLLPELFDQVKISLPLLGTNLRKLAIARFCRSMATLFSSGLDLRRSLKLSLKTMANSYMEKRCGIIEKAIDEGQMISEGLRAAGVFPANFVQTFAIGERTGDIDKVLNKVAEYYEFEADKATKAILTMLPVFIYLCVAAYIGYIVISFYTGYFNAIGNITK
jgi:type IV pilus assembly protein PilC